MWLNFKLSAISSWCPKNCFIDTFLWHSQWWLWLRCMQLTAVANHTSIWSDIKARHTNLGALMTQENSGYTQTQHTTAGWFGEIATPYLLFPDSFFTHGHAGRNRGGRASRGEGENASPLQFFTLIWNTGDKRASAIWEQADCERISVTTLIRAVVERGAEKANSSVTTACHTQAHTLSLDPQMCKPALSDILIKKTTTTTIVCQYSVYSVHVYGLLQFL